jgi:hypothetical protein
MVTSPSFFPKRPHKYTWAGWWINDKRLFAFVSIGPGVWTNEVLISLESFHPGNF